MTDASGFGKFVPGFDFLQSLVSNAGAALPNVGQWIVPTLDPDELEKRINELRTVQFWLEQNSRMLATTIQALEVQRMTLSTLRGMNVSMGDLQAGLAAKPPAPPPAPAFSAPPPAADPPPAEPGAAPAASAVDPMQWWGSLTQQFSKIAADAMQQAAGPVAAAAQQAAAATAAPAAAKAPVPRKARPPAKGSGRAGGGTQSP
jgi:hypothetical protein